MASGRLLPCFPEKGIRTWVKFDGDQITCPRLRGRLQGLLSVPESPVPASPAHADRTVWLLHRVGVGRPALTPLPPLPADLVGVSEALQPGGPLVETRGGS